MPDLASHEYCTGCGACAYRCPQSCITMREDAVGVIYPFVETSDCIGCNACIKVCPIINPVMTYCAKTCYAAWNLDSEDRYTSASGGVASAIYQESIIHGYIAFGASMNSDWQVMIQSAATLEQLASFKNSKYVFSQAYDIFPEIKTILNESKQAVIIGLPCQIAAVRSLFGERDNMLLIDLVCHGSTPTKYLRQHIAHLEQEAGQKAAGVSFRAPEKGTANYFFTLYNTAGEIFYSKRSSDGDTYNIAFHRSISYRENCYHCIFARPERVSDLTLGDFHGLGSIKPCQYTEEKVSTVLIHTDKGHEFIKNIIKERKIYAEERPVEESINGDVQLQHPSLKSAARKDFEKYIYSTGCDFEQTMSYVLKNIQKQDAKMKFKVFYKSILHKILNKIGLSK